MRVLALAVLGSLSSLPAGALFNDYIELWAAGNVTRDTNVFRLSDSVAPSSVGASQRGDTILSTYLGFIVNVPVAQQRFEASYTWNRADYRTFDNLDYDGHNARVAWDYNFQNKVTGVASYTDRRTLSSFSNIQANVKDVVTTRQGQVTTQWLATPRYRVDGRIADVRTEHSDPGRSINDIEIWTAEGGLSYVTPKENVISGLVRYEHGQSPQDTLITSSTAVGGNPFSRGPAYAPPIGTLFNNEYEQWGAGAGGTWNLTGHSRFDGRVELVRRRYNQFTERNYSGPIARALYRWTPTPKFTLDVGALRDVGPPEEIQASFVIVTGGYVRPQWRVTEKITLQGNVEYNVWDYHAAIPEGDFRNRQRLIGASAQWKPLERIWLQAGVNREKRTSTLLYADYDVTVAFVEGRVGF